MILGFAEDFSSSIELDSQLTAVPDSGMYFNSGVHESITIDNLLQFLPKLDYTFGTYSAGTTYGKFEDSRLRTDIVLDSGIIYQSLTASNVGNTPASSPSNWLVTNIESLRLKAFIFKVEDRVLSSLKLTKRLVDSQYLYSVGDVIKDSETTLSGDFSGWAFEPKGSDYVAIKINEISLQASNASPVSLYVVNQGVLLDTLTLNPTAAGTLVFADNPKVLFGNKGKYILSFANEGVFTNGASINPLKFDGFVSYPVTGTGASAQASEYNAGTSSNGLNFNITAYLDSSKYVTDNIVYFANFTQATFELACLEMFLVNANNRSNRENRVQMSNNLLEVEVKDLTNNTVANKYERERKRAFKQLEKTFDNQLSEGENEFMIKVGSN